jgi:hypothetical protein
MTDKEYRLKKFRECGQLNMRSPRSKIIHIRQENTDDALCGLKLKDYFHKFNHNCNYKRCTKCKEIYLNRIEMIGEKTL